MKALMNHQLEMTTCSRNKLDGVSLIQSKFLSRPPALRIKAVGCCLTTRSLKQRISGNGCHGYRGNSRRSITDENSVAWLSCGTLTLRFSQFHWWWVLEAMIPHSLINQAAETTRNDGRWSFHLTYTVCTSILWFKCLRPLVKKLFRLYLLSIYYRLHYIKKILTCVPKMNETLMGLEQPEGE